MCGVTHFSSETPPGTQVVHPDACIPIHRGKSGTSRLQLAFHCLLGTRASRLRTWRCGWKFIPIQSGAAPRLSSETPLGTRASRPRESPGGWQI